MAAGSQRWGSTKDAQHELRIRLKASGGDCAAPEFLTTEAEVCRFAPGCFILMARKSPETECGQVFQFEIAVELLVTRAAKEGARSWNT